MTVHYDDKYLTYLMTGLIIDESWWKNEMKQKIKLAVSSICYSMGTEEWSELKIQFVTNCE